MNMLILLLGLLVVTLGIGLKLYACYQEKKCKLFIPLVIIGLILMITSQSFVIIPTGYTGVRTTFGIVSKNTMPNGFNTKAPLVQKIAKVNNKKQDITYTGQIWSESLERTAMFYENITITYQINPEKSAWIYANVANYKDVLMSENLVASAIKSVSKTLPAIDATNRAIVEPKAQEAIQESLNSKYGPDVISVIKVIVENVDFEDSYNTAIADKMNEQLLYEKQQIENKKSIEKAEAEAKAKIVTINAEAEAKRISSQAEADAILYKAEAQAKANKLIADSWSDAVVQQKFYDKWDGSFPSVVGSTNDMILDISSFVK